MNAKVMMVNNIRTINKKTGEIEKPGDYEKRPSIKQMRENEITLKKLEDERDELARKDHLALVDARHEYYRTHKEGDMGYEEWSALNKEEQTKLEKEKEEEPESDIKSVRESKSVIKNYNKFVSKK